MRVSLSPPRGPPGCWFARARERARAGRVEERRRGLRSRAADGCAEPQPRGAPSGRPQRRLSFVAANMFSVRVVTADYYMSSPLSGLDPCQSSFREAPVKKVPVVRVFGATPSGKDERPLARSGHDRGEGVFVGPGDPASLLPFLFGGGADGPGFPDLLSLSLPLRLPPRDVGALQREPPLPAPAAVAVEQTRRFPRRQSLCTSERCAGGLTCEPRRARFPC